MPKKAKKSEATGEAEESKFSKKKAASKMSKKMAKLALDLSDEECDDAELSSHNENGWFFSCFF